MTIPQLREATETLLARYLAAHKYAHSIRFLPGPERDQAEQERDRLRHEYHNALGALERAEHPEASMAAFYRDRAPYPNWQGD